MELSPDGRNIWTGTKWVPVNPVDSIQTNPQRNISDEQRRQIENMANVMIDKLHRGDMASAKECWNQAKMIDLNTTKLIFETQKSREISDAYLLLAETNLANFQLLYDNPSFGIDFKVKVEMAPQSVEMALNNATTFGTFLDSFRYNFLYARMWLYCNKFDLVWNKEYTKERFYTYLERAEQCSTTTFQYQSIADLQDLLERNEAERRAFFSTQIIESVGLIIGIFLGIILLIYLVNL